MGQMRSQVDLLHETSKIVSSGLTLDEMLRELIQLAVQVTACDACLIYLAEPEGGVVLRASQLPHTNEIGHIRIKIGEGVTGWVAEHKSAVALASKAAADKRLDRKSTRLNSSHLVISYAVFCLKKKKKT